MSASALPKYDHANFAHSLVAFANALFGPATGNVREADSPAAKAVADALAAGRTSKVFNEARILAYRALVSRFVRISRAQSGTDPSSPAAPERQHTMAPTDADITIAALHLLAPVEKAILLLVVVERLSYADAAMVMDLEIPTLTAALARGREAFAARVACAKGGGRAHLRLVGDHNDP